MTRISRWIFWLVLARLGACLVHGEFFVLSKPAEYRSPFLEKQGQEMYCVTDDVGSALSWNHNLEWKYPSYAPNVVVGKPVVLPNNKYVYPTNDNFTCQMNHMSPCSYYWSRPTTWVYVNTLTKPMAPVFDNRWEDFKEETMSDRFMPMMSFYSTGSLIVSIRGSSDAHFALCNRHDPRDFCFFVILGGWKNTLSVIRKCEMGIPELATEMPSDSCARRLAEFNATVLSSTEWKTFVFKWDFRTRIALEIFDSKQKILSYEEVRNNNNYFMGQPSISSNNVEYYLFARSRVKMIMKFHIYGYSITTTRQSKISSPKIMSTSSDGNMCIEMAVSLCEKCIMYVDFIDRNNQSRPAATISRKVSSNIYGLPTWQYVKISRSLKINDTVQMKQPITLEINTILNNNTYRNDVYWAISNIRRCYDGALKFVKINNHQDFDHDTNNYLWPNVTCQKISPGGISAIIKSNDHKFAPLDNRLLCPEGIIGPSCLARCSTLFPEFSDCRNLFACNEKGCSCAPGYIMPTCDKNCPVSMYGFDCKQKCGNCAHDSCSRATGECKDGCYNTDSNLFLSPYCKKGVSSPPAPTVELLNSTCVRISLDMKEEYKLISTIIYFEIWNMTSRFYTSDQIVIQTNSVSIETFAEHLSPGTKYKVLGILNAGNKFFRGEWQHFTALCTEFPAVNFALTSNETSITLSVKRDMHVNDSCPDTWYSVQLSTQRDLLFNNSTIFPKTFSELEPYTLYKIKISSEKSNIFDKTVKTLEGAPGTVTNLQIVPSSNDKISFTWEPPDKPRGKIVNYTIEVQPIQSLGCNDFNKPSYNSSTNNTDGQFVMRTVIANRQQNSFSYTFSGLNPYTRYLVTVYAYTARHQGEKAVLHHMTEQLKIPTEIFSNLRLTNESDQMMAAMLRWNPPSNCLTNTGPIRASKVLIMKSSRNLTEMETKQYDFPLEKSIFQGTETYHVRVFPLRDFGGTVNKTTYTSMNFTMPARAPPPIRNEEIIEVDTRNKTITLRWEAPRAPLHGSLEHYSIIFCHHAESCNKNVSFIIRSKEFCQLWNLEDTLCKTVPLPSSDYRKIQITAHNENVTEASEPVHIFIKYELAPSPPRELSLTLLQRENGSVGASWRHPFRSGGRLTSFEIETRVLSSRLKVEPAEQWRHSLEISEYRPRYSATLDLLPATTFIVYVRARTYDGLLGPSVEARIDLPSFVNFSAQDLRPKTRDADTTIAIRIPEVTNDVRDSVMLVVVQGPKYCGEGKSNNEDVDLYLDNQSSTYYSVAWKAATLTKPESYANKEFTIGDGNVYGGSANYALCPKESYIINLVLVDDSKVLQDKRYADQGRNVLKALKTNAVHLGELPKNYAMWLTPLFFIILITLLLAFIVYRKKLASRFLMNKPKSRQENMPLSNDFGKKKSNNSMNEVETDTKIKDVKDVPNNNLFIVERKVEFVMPVKVTDFESYFESAYKSDALENEYASITHGPTKPCFYGSQPETKPKNRYANLFPYDDTRVILEKLSDDPYSDYINANFITGYGGKEKAYIATQGPKPHTVVDFWRMIWQEKVQIICMMANLIENGKNKCEQYWPSAVGKKILYGTISVQFSSEEVHSDYTYRTFKVSCGSQDIRTLEHLHYTAWPDHGVPSNPRSIVAFLQELQRHAPIEGRADQPPIVVHCSAGVGRTGTLIVLDMCLCQAFSEKVIYVFANVLSVRQERLNMVGNTEQYLLVHLVLVVYLKDTCFTCDKTLPERISEARKNSSLQYQRILDTSWWNGVLGSPPLPEKTLSNRNRAKHRFPETAAGLNRLYLKRSIRTDEDSDYIAATCVKGIFKDCQYITTQLPLPTTSADFWRMLSEQNVEYVLVLQLPNLQDSTYCELVPENQGFGSTKYLKVIRQENSTTDSQYYFKEEVLIIDSSEQPSKEQIVKIFSYKNWPESSLPPPNELVELWKILEELPKKDKCPIVIACCNGVTASGLWLASSFLLKRMTVDKECDVPQAVRAIKRCRKDFLNQPKYLEYLYDVALAHSVEN